MFQLIAAHTKRKYLSVSAGILSVFITTQSKVQALVLCMSDILYHTRNQ